MGDDVVLSCHAWPSNAELIADAARLGYLDGTVLDCTYGIGVFWKKFQPERLVRSDLIRTGDLVADFTHLPFADGTFDSVVFDGPYKLNGTPSDADVRYRVHKPTHWQDRMWLLYLGMLECLRVSKRYVLSKSMDQVCSGQKRWQSDLLTGAATSHHGWEKVDRFDLLVTPRPQPGGRRQVHSQANTSQLLVFEKKGGSGRRV